MASVSETFAAPLRVSDGGRMNMATPKTKRATSSVTGAANRRSAPRGCSARCPTCRWWSKKPWVDKEKGELEAHLCKRSTLPTFDAGAARDGGAIATYSTFGCTNWQNADLSRADNAHKQQENSNGK